MKMLHNNRFFITANNCNRRSCPLLGIELIALTNGKYAIVDKEDYAKLATHKWRAKKDGNTYYAVSTLNKKTLLMHRIVLNLKKGEGPHVDHKNRNGLDNRKINIWPCTNSQNQINAVHRERAIGCTYNKTAKKWQAQIKIKGKRIYLGVFNKKEDAKLIYEVAKCMIA
jgi:hypothetical protein